MSNVRWSIVVPEETDRALRSFLAQRGTKKGDISRFVDEAVQSRLFELTVESVNLETAVGQGGGCVCGGAGQGATTRNSQSIPRSCNAAMRRRRRAVRPVA